MSHTGDHPRGSVLIEVGCATLLPTVGTHERPISASQLRPQFTSTAEAALFLITDSWERVLRGSDDPTNTSSAAVPQPGVDIQQHYLSVLAATESSPQISSATVALQRVAAGERSVEGLPRVTLATIRAKLALQRLALPTYASCSAQALEAVRASGLLDRLSVRLETAPLQVNPSNATDDAHKAVLFTSLLLTQSRSTKQVAARKWISFVSALPQSTSSNVTTLMAASFLASLTWCIPSAESQAAMCRVFPDDKLPTLHPQFVALFWCAVIEQLSHTEATTTASSSFVTVKALMPVIVDYFYVMVATHLGEFAAQDAVSGRLMDATGSTRTSPIFHAARTLPITQSTKEGLPPAVFDAYFGIFMPAIWQQVGFEWPWSAFVRLTRANVNDARRVAGGDALSKRADHFWNDIACVLAPRAYKQRLEEVLAASLQPHVDVAFVLDATRVYPLPVEHEVLTDLGRLASETTLKLSQATPGDTVAINDIIHLATIALDALPYIVQLRRTVAAKARDGVAAGGAALLDARLAGVLWIFLTATRRLAVPSQYRDLFLASFAPALEKIRSAADANIIGAEAEDAHEQTQALPTRSPFVTAALLWVASIVDTRRDDAERREVLRRRVGAQLLHFMASSYLPLTTHAAPTTATVHHSVGLSITARDIIAVFVFASPLSANDSTTSHWKNADADLRLSIRNVAQRVEELASRFCGALRSDAPADDVTRQILRLEREQLLQWLRFLTQGSEGKAGSLCWVPATAMLQATLC